MNFSQFPVVTSREKIINVSKKVFSYIYLHKHRVFNIYVLIQQFGAETKKLLEIIFILEGLGLIKFLEVHTFVFIGLKGMISVFQENVIAKSELKYNTLQE